jgi:hypothetical protein
MKDLYYELTSDGYHIYDRNDSLFHIHQYEPYIPDHSKTYEENAKAQIHEFMVQEYVEAVTSSTMTIDAVPAEYKAEVEAKLPTPIEPTYTLDEAATILAQEVSA